MKPTYSSLPALFAISSIVLAALSLPEATAAVFREGTCLRLANVESWDFLYIRRRPDHRSRKVGAIRYNSDSLLVVSGRCTPNTTNLRQLWCPIQYYLGRDTVLKGYIKMHFTSKRKCPASFDYYRGNR